MGHYLPGWYFGTQMPQGDCSFGLGCECPGSVFPMIKLSMPWDHFHPLWCYRCPVVLGSSSTWMRRGTTWVHCLHGWTYGFLRSLLTWMSLQMSQGHCLPGWGYIYPGVIVYLDRAHIALRTLFSWMVTDGLWPVFTWMRLGMTWVHC